MRNAVNDIVVLKDFSSVIPGYSSSNSDIPRWKYIYFSYKHTTGHIYTTTTSKLQLLLRVLAFGQTENK